LSRCPEFNLSDSPVPTGGCSPAVSVVVPCRNEKDYIAACVNSILAQAQPPGGIEIFVVDGMSEDGTRAILAHLARSAPQLTVVDNPAQITPCARNLGLGRAAGEFVAFLDAQMPGKINFIRAYEALREASPDSRIFVSTGEATDYQLDEYIRSAAGRIVKPASQEVLQSFVERHLGNRRVPA